MRSLTVSAGTLPQSTEEHPMFVVAGVTGHVGKVVAEELLRREQKVRVVVRSAEKGATWAKQGAELAVGSLDDQAFLSKALGGAQALFVLLPPNYEAADFFVSQKKTSDAIAGAVKASGIPHVVMLSSIGANHAEGTGPIKGLHYLENALRATGVTLSALRAGSFQENVAMSLGAAKQMGVYPNFVASADYPVPVVATKDIGALAVQLLLHKPVKSETVDLVGPTYSSRQVAEKLGAAIGKTLQVVDIPPAGAVEALKKGGLPAHLAELFAEMYDAANKGLLVPVGDRLEKGSTTLDDTIRHIVGKG
jgi:uncharacterized protein YbjT (DUF2867 family)